MADSALPFSNIIFLFFFFLDFYKWNQNSFIFKQVQLPLMGGVKQRGMSQAKLTHPESGCYFSLIFPELPFLGSLNALISCLLATRAEHMVCLKILVKRVSINLTVGSAKEKQESSQTLTSSPKQTHSPLKHTRSSTSGKSNQRKLLTFHPL